MIACGDTQRQRRWPELRLPAFDDASIKQQQLQRHKGCCRNCVIGRGIGIDTLMSRVLAVTVTGAGEQSSAPLITLPRRAFLAAAARQLWLHGGDGGGKETIDSRDKEPCVCF